MPTVVRESLPALRMPSLRRLKCTKPGETAITGWRWPDGGLTGVRVHGSVDGIGVEGVLPPLMGWSAFVPWSWSRSPYGQRAWLTCPRCGRRVGTLCIVDGPDLECGDCTGLPYAMATLGRAERLQQKRRLARRACGLDFHGGGELRRPKGMRTKRWIALLDQLSEAETDVLASLGVEVPQHTGTGS